MAQDIATAAPEVRVISDPRHLQDIGTEVDWPAGLSVEHRTYQRSRAVGPRIAAERALYTATSAGHLPELEAGGYTSAVRKALDTDGNSAMVIPLYNPYSGDAEYPVTYQLRVDDPPANAQGKRQKFCLPRGLKREDETLPPDVHPLAADWAADASVPLIITEGQAKADAMLTAAFREGIRACPVTLTGVSLGYIAGKDGAEPTLAPGLWQFPLRGRDAYLVFDADSMTNPMVKSALRTTARLLEQEGATVYIPRIPATKTDPKRGADDYIAAELDKGALYPLAMLLNAARSAGEVFVDVPGADLVATSMGAAGVTVPDLVRAWDGRKILVQDGVMAVIGGQEHGLWTASKRWNAKLEREELVVERFTDWIAWRRRYDVQVQIDSRGLEAPVSGQRPRWTVQIVRADRRTWEVTDLTDTESTDPVRVVDIAGAAVAVPTTLAHKAVVANALRVLGADGAGQYEGRRFTSVGWMLHPQHGVTFVAPTGSMTADGPVTGVEVGPPAGSDDDALTDAQRTTGWDRIAEGDELREAARAFQALIDMAPGRPEAGIALIGAMAAAPLRLSRRGSVMLKALPGAGKGHMLGAAGWFWNATGPSSFAFDFPGSSEAAAKAIASWHRDAPMLADDFKLAGDEGDLGIKRAFGALVRGSYTGASNAKATMGGGMRRGLPISTVALMTGEEMHPDAATMQRVAVIELVQGDVDLTPGGPVDEFATTYGATGLARAVWASYMRWLAGLMDAAQQEGEDPLLYMRRQSEEQWRDAMQRLGTDRAGETAAVVAAGWAALTAWAEAVGVADLLPDSETVLGPGLHRLASGNSTSHAEADPAARVLRVLGELVERRAAYVERHDGRLPVAPDVCGWVRDDRSVTGWASRGGLYVGRLSRDGSVVVVSPAAVTAAISQGGLGIAPAKLAAAMTAAGYVGGRDVRAPSTLGIEGRPRGWHVPVEHLGIEPELLQKEEASDVDSF